MRRFFCLYVVLMIFPLFLRSQDFTEIIQVSEKNINQLYNLAREWVALSTRDYKMKVLLDDYQS
ncbi:MAG: hypothetical protein WCJ95_17585 [Mariniphaga sp.]